MSQSMEDARLQAQVVHCLGSWLAAYTIPQAYLISSKLLCIPFSAMVRTLVSLSIFYWGYYRTNMLYRTPNPHPNPSLSVC